MKKTKLIVATVAMLCLGATPSQAQSLKDILSGVEKAVVGNKATSAKSIVGTWTYEKPECQFTSDNLLAKAGGAAASSKVEEQLASLYKMAGIPGSKLTFNSDNTYTSVVRGRTMKGTYTFDEKAKTVTLKVGLKTTVTAHVATSGSELTLLMDANKLMDGIKTISSYASKLNSTASLANSLISNYDGMRLGFKAKKTK